jgi:hypothetical protein
MVRTCVGNGPASFKETTMDLFLLSLFVMVSVLDLELLEDDEDCTKSFFGGGKLPCP